METLQDFKQVLQELQRLKDENKLYKLDDNMLFDGAVRIYNSHIISTSRQPRPVGKNGSKKESAMTEKQRALLENLEYRGNMNISKREAADIIKSQLERQKAAA